MKFSQSNLIYISMKLCNCPVVLACNFVTLNPHRRPNVVHQISKKFTSNLSSINSNIFSYKCPTQRNFKMLLKHAQLQIKQQVHSKRSYHIDILFIHSINRKCVCSFASTLRYTQSRLSSMCLKKKTLPKFAGHASLLKLV